MFTNHNCKQKINCAQCYLQPLVTGCSFRSTHGLPNWPGLPSTVSGNFLRWIVPPLHPQRWAHRIPFYPLTALPSPQALALTWRRRPGLSGRGLRPDIHCIFVRFSPFSLSQEINLEKMERICYSTNVSNPKPTSSEIICSQPFYWYFAFRNRMRNKVPTDKVRFTVVPAKDWTVGKKE